ncbi:MAG: Lrp/AsnC family transcriptional regulator [Mesorhizobium sp.]|nr:MAG: Lrp/AsnC family transcriptional regulator [Mesorhizobium sp.]TIX33496.1 MAG: Lrp/AsnC family transcriptional regulator [Mesorhizobium sp.]
MTELDRIDVALLGAVQKNNRLTSEELAEIVNLSPTACQRRLKRLRAERVIEADVAIVSPKAVGRHITMIVLVSLERERADIVDRFKAAIRNTHEVMIGFYVTGDADFILVVTAKDMEDYEEFTRRFFYENHDIKGFKTMVVMDRVKASFAVPLEVIQHLAQTPGK